MTAMTVTATQRAHRAGPGSRFSQRPLKAVSKTSGDPSALLIGRRRRGEPRGDSSGIATIIGASYPQSEVPLRIGTAHHKACPCQRVEYSIPPLRGATIVLSLDPIKTVSESHAWHGLLIMNGAVT
jgi:hypothetical protein